MHAKVRNNVRFVPLTKQIGRETTCRWRMMLAIIGIIAGSNLARPANAQILDQFISPSVPGTAAEPEVTVGSRYRPEFETEGVHAGSFIIRPTLVESAGYEDNPAGTTPAQGSALIRTNAALRADSDWSRNSLSALLTVDDFRYTSLSKYSYTNWSASAGGTYEIERDVITALYSHLNQYQTPRDLDVPQLGQSIPYTIDTARLSYRVQFSRLYVTPGIDVSLYRFTNGTLVNGQPYEQTFRNRTVVTPSLIAGYELAPRRNLVVVLRDSNAEYVKAQSGMKNRNYNDVALLAGLDFDATALVRFRVLGGYEVRTFTDPSFVTIRSPIVEASAIWTPTGLTTVTATAARRIQDSADDTTAAYTTTSLYLQVDHELLRNILLQGSAGVYLGDYAGGGNQNLYTAGVSATYLINRNMRLTASYDLAVRRSSGNGNLGQSQTQFGPSYNDNRYLLQLRLAL